MLQALGTAIAFVALAWLPVAAIDLAARTRHDARLTPTAVENAGAINSKGLVHAITRLRATIPEGDTYQLDAYASRVSFWAYTSLLPRVAVGPGAGADWRIVWHRHPAGPPRRGRPSSHRACGWCTGRHDRAPPRPGRRQPLLPRRRGRHRPRARALAGAARPAGRVVPVLYLVGVAARGSSRRGRSWRASSSRMAGRRGVRPAGSGGCRAAAPGGLDASSAATTPAAPRGRGARSRRRSGCIVVLLLVDAAYRPLSEWDAWAMWTMKAKAITLLGGLDPGVLAGVPYHHLHLDYPLLLPAVEAMGFRFMGSIDTQVIHLQPALLTGRAPRVAAAPPRRPGARRHRMGVGAPHRRGTVARRPGGRRPGRRAARGLLRDGSGLRLALDRRRPPRDARALGALRRRRARDQARGDAVRGRLLPRHARRRGPRPEARRGRRGRRRGRDGPPVAAVAALERRRHVERRDPVRQGRRPRAISRAGSGGSRRAPRRSSGTRSSRARGSSSCRPRRWRWSSRPGAASAGRPCSSPQWRASSS